MESKQSEVYGASSNPDETDERRSELKHATKNDKTDRRRAKSLPVYSDESSLKDLRRKRVQFADTMGLNLAIVRHFDISDDANETCNVSGLQSYPPTHYLISALKFARLVPTFNKSVSSVELLLKTRRLGVALESVTTGSEVKGVIRVMASNERREVGIRYTSNNWLTFSDIQADLKLDEENVLKWEQFEFTLHAPPCFDADSSVHFAVFCRANHREYWDNNDGQNYTLRIQTD